MSLIFVIMKHCGGLISSSNVDFIGLPYSKIYEFCKLCKDCQNLGLITKRNMMPLYPIIEIEIFDCWGIDFMGPFPPSFGFVYILIAIDYVSKWIKAFFVKIMIAKLWLNF